jgi:thiamine kinase-like enzyme
VNDAPVVEDDLLIAVAARFGLGEIAGRASYVDGGVSGEVFKITTAVGEWGVKRLFREPDLAGLEVQIRLQDAARSAGVASPRPIRTTDGGVVATVGGAHWLASEWTDVSRGPAALVDRDRLSGVGDIVARLHGLGLRPPHDVTPWLTTPPTPAEWVELRTLVCESDPLWARNFEELCPDLVRLAEFAGSVAHEASVLSHCDLGPSNFGAADDHLVVFDWERACAIPPAQELGYVLIQWAELGDPEAIVPPIVASYLTRSKGRVSVGRDMFACAANAYLNFLRSAIRGANDDRVRQMLDKPMTLGSIQTLVDLARAS